MVPVLFARYMSLLCYSIFTWFPALGPKKSLGRDRGFNFIPVGAAV